MEYEEFTSILTREDGPTVLFLANSVYYDHATERSVGNILLGYGKKDANYCELGNYLLVTSFFNNSGDGAEVTIPEDILERSFQCIEIDDQTVALLSPIQTKDEVTPNITQAWMGYISMSLLAFNGTEYLSPSVGFYTDASQELPALIQFLYLIFDQVIDWFEPKDIN